MTTATAPSVRALDLYERWAPTYAPDAHNPLMRAEQTAMLAALPRVAGMRALDLACGTGRYTQLLRLGGVASVVGVDFASGMLRRVDGASCVQADMNRLPFMNCVFDLAVSGLAVGHAATLPKWALGVARVLTARGILLYSDFHPEAARAGLTRSFKDAQDRAWTLPHHRHEIADHLAALAGARLGADLISELRVGDEINESFPGGERFYREWRGLPLVLVIRARR